MSLHWSFDLILDALGCNMILVRRYEALQQFRAYLVLSDGRLMQEIFLREGKFIKGRVVICE